MPRRVTSKVISVFSSVGLRTGVGTSLPPADSNYHIKFSGGAHSLDPPSIKYGLIHHQFIPLCPSSIALLFYFPPPFLALLFTLKINNLNLFILFLSISTDIAFVFGNPYFPRSASHRVDENQFIHHHHHY